MPKAGAEVGTGIGAGTGHGPGQRLDRWLWAARFFRQRTQAAAFVEKSGVRIAGTIVRKAHHPVRIGATLTFALGDHIRIVDVLALAERRGPAADARLLYRDRSGPPSRDRAPGQPVAGPRPGSRDRAAARRLKSNRDVA